jgi:hypothetical protein
MIRFCSSFAVAILAGLVIFLFLLLQYVSFQLAQEQDELDQLQTTLSENRQDKVQELTDKVDQEHLYTLYQMAGTFYASQMFSFDYLLSTLRTVRRAS